MPFVESQDLPVSKAIGVPELAGGEEGPTFQEQLRAAYRLENTIGSFVARDGDLPDSDVTNPEFNPFDHFTEDEKLDDVFLSQAVLADNSGEIEGVRRQIERERSDRQILSEGGLAPMFIAAIADPVNLIPVGGTTYKTYRTGGSILQGARATSMAAAGSTALTEAGLQYTQIERTYGESALNIGAAGFLGGVLGATPGALKSMLSKNNIDEAKLYAEIENTFHPEKDVDEGFNPAQPMGDKSMGAAQVMDDPQVRGKLAKAMTKFFGFDPLSRTITSDSKATRQATNRLAENPIAVDGGLARTSVESNVKVYDGLYYKGIQQHHDIYKEYKKGGGTLSRKGFNEEVSKALRNGSDEELIQRSADAWRKEVYDPIKKKAIEQKLLPDDVDVTTAENYLNRVWNKQKLIAGRSKFVSTVSDWLRSGDEVKVQIQERVVSLSESLGEKSLKSSNLETSIANKKAASAKLEKQISEVLAEKKKTVERAFMSKDAKISERKKKGRRQEISARERSASNRLEKLRAQKSRVDEEVSQKEARLLSLQSSSKKTLNDLRDSVAQWKGKSSEEIVRIIKGGDGADMSSMTKALKKAVSKISKKDLEGVDYISLAEEIAVRIEGTPDGRLPYDYQVGTTSTGASTNAGKAGVFKKRSFDIPDNLVEDFLENDIEELAQRYVRKTAPDIELTKEFGDLELTSIKKDIANDYDKLIAEAKTDKERLKLGKRRDRDISDLAAMRDRIRGVHNIADSNNPWVRAVRVARDLNYMRLLGGVVAASIPDVARIVASEGIVRTFKDGLLPLATNLKTFKVAATEAKGYGVGIDALIGGRAEILADIGDFSKGGTAFERGVRTAAQKFSSINLMNHWTSGVKQLHAVVTQTRLIDELTKGKYDPRLSQLGIDENTAQSIASQMKKHSRSVDGVKIANADAWENQELAGIWRAAIRNESDRVVIVPGQEKPLFMSTEMGKTIFQFKTFMLSATQRIMIGGLQGRDAHFMQGMLGLVSLGMMSYAFKQWDAGREITDDPAALVVEGIDRSGMLGILMEMNNTLEKISSNNYGMRPILGVSAPASRYASRSVAESAVGPTFGLINDVVKAANGLSSGQDWTEADTRTLRRLIPGQNLSIMRQGFDQIEEGINEFSGVK